MLSVTCTQCNAHYTMSEELYRRKGGGQAVIVTCKRCKAEIRFDADDAPADKATHRALPRAKVSVSKALEGNDESGPFVALSSGFFGPDLGSSRSGESSLPFPKLPESESSLDSAVDSAAVQPVHVSSPAASKSGAVKSAASRPSPEKPVASPEKPVASPDKSAPEKPASAKTPALLDDDEAMSVRSTDMLDESVTVPLVAPKQQGTGTLRRLPAPPPPRRKEGEHEPVPPPRRTVEEDFEPAPPSSSGTPTLTTLMGESTASHSPKQPSKKPDDFLVNLSATPETVLGPPTIDLTTIGAPNVEAKESEPPPASESEPPPSTLGSVAPVAKKRRAETRSGAPSARPSAEPKRNQPSAASAPVAKPAEQREPSQRSLGLWIGVLALVGLGVGAVLFKSPKQEQPIAQNEPPVIQPSVPAEQARPVEAPVASVNSEPAATASAAFEPAPSVAEKKPEKVAQPQPSEALPSAPAADAKPTEAKPAAEAKPEDAKPAAEAEAKPAEPSAAAAEPPPAQHGPFQPEAAKAALAEAAAQAAVCRKGDDPAGSATVIITFAPSGRVTTATLNGPPFAGTATGGCIASTMRSARVPPFDGDKITVSKTIYVQ